MKETVLAVISAVPVPVQVVGLIFFYVLFMVANNVCFKLSAQAKGWKAFVGWQAGGYFTGTMAGFLITGLYYYVPMHIALPLLAGLVMAGVQIVAARMIFHETIQPQQWAGTALMIAAIALICYRK